MVGGLWHGRMWMKVRGKVGGGAHTRAFIDLNFTLPYPQVHTKGQQQQQPVAAQPWPPHSLPLLRPFPP